MSSRLVAKLGEGLRPGDRELVAAQLGRLKYEPLAVLSRCPAGYPQVVLSYRGPDTGPSSNVLWLTCPHLRKQVDRVEGRSRIGELEDEIAADPAASARFAADQAQHAREVDRLVAALPEGSPHPATGRGIGGGRNQRRLKCLHAHLSFHLALGPGLVGERVIAELAGSAGSEAAVLLCPEGRCPGT